MSSAAVQLVGIPLSTYTRTIRMALEHLQVPYELIPAAPHSAKAVEYNPFGKIPTMIHDGLIINETPAIRTYLDQTFPSTLTPAMDLNASVNIAMWISITADYIFGGLNLSLCKVRYALEDKGSSELEIEKELAEQITKARETLRNLETVFKKTTGGRNEDTSYLVGYSLTWADLFVFPVFADLCSLPERRLVEREAPALFSWFKRMEKHKVAIATYPETVAAARL